jgi:hypothetical protein
MANVLALRLSADLSRDLEPLWGHQLYLEALGIRLESYVFFAADAGMSKNVLGRRGWLDMLKVGIIDYDGELYLSRYETV